MTFKMFANNENKDLFSIVHWNCAGGLMGKLDEIRVIIEKTTPKLIFISESEVRNPLHEQACQLSNYTMVTSHESSSMMSRLICYTDSKVLFDRKIELEGPDYLEIIVIDCQTEKERYIGVYNPFKIPEGMSKSTYNKELLECLKIATITPMDVIIVGDFNIDVGFSS